MVARNKPQRTQTQGDRSWTPPYLVVALMVGDTLSILPVEIEAVLYQELHRLWFYDILFHAQ